MNDYNPFDVISGHPHWTLWTRAVLPSGEQGRWYDDAQVMLLDRGLGRVGRRCTAAHEVEHALAGDRLCRGTIYDQVFEAKSERRAMARAARKLIPIEALARALRLHEGDDEAVADFLDVDLDALDVRRVTLQPAELLVLRQELQRLEQSA